MIVIDVETTGTNPKENSILGIGAVDLTKLDSDDPSRAFFYGECKIWPGAKIDQKALEINGFTETEARYTNPEEHRELLNRWAFWIKDNENHTLCGENVFFDANFMREGLIRAGYSEKIARELVGIRNIDLHTLSYHIHQINNIKPPMNNCRSGLFLDETLKFVGLQQEAKPHNALIGAILEAEAYTRLSQNCSLFAGWPLKSLIPDTFPHPRFSDIPNFSKYSIPDYLKRKHK